MSINDGGTVFPVTPTDCSGQIGPTVCGMSLRDWFAGQATDQDIARWQDKLSRCGFGDTPGFSLTREAARYYHADAMLVHRESSITSPTCVWTESDDGNWDASCCGRVFEFTHGGPVENKFTHCPYCGARLGEKGGTA